MVFRFSFLIVILILAYGAVLFHLYQLQIVKGDYYLARAGSESIAGAVATANRGNIYFTDKDGNKLPAALNKQYPIVYAVPKVIDDYREAANTVAPILKRSVPELEKILSKKDDTYEVLAKKVDSAVAQQIEDLHMKGIYADVVPGRFYPLGDFASHVLGFVGPNGKDAGETGRYGMEKFYEEQLGGESGKVVDGKLVPARQGEDVTLTIDPNIEMEAERILKNLITTYRATGGSVIVEEPKTGKILAMGSLPNFDPNAYGDAPLANFMNPVVQQIYEPGSVFKVLTMAAGIDAGKISPDTKYFDKGSLTMNGRTIQNYDLKTHGAYGWATMTNVIEHSINTGAVFAEQKIGRDVFTRYITNFGFSKKTGVDLPGEVAGNLKRLSPKERDIAFATASYGQGVAVTPLEIVEAMGAIANGGMLMRPYVNAELEPKALHAVISPATARLVTGMMVSAVDRAGVAAISGYSLAGKTGSAFIPDFKKGGYTDQLIDSYAGYGPTSDPRFLILFKVDGLDSSQLAALSVVPAFRELAQYILNYYEVPPDRIPSGSSANKP